MSEDTIVTTSVRIEMDTYQWIRDYIYTAAQQQRRQMSINGVINLLLVEAIEARKQRPQYTESK